MREREMGRIWVLEASKEEEMRQKNKISRMKLRFGGERAAEAKLKGKNKLLDFFRFSKIKNYFDHFWREKSLLSVALHRSFI